VVSSTIEALGRVLPDFIFLSMQPNWLSWNMDLESRDQLKILQCAGAGCV
jgi:hypothetical protein